MDSGEFECLAAQERNILYWMETLNSFLLPRSIQYKHLNRLCKPLAEFSGCDTIADTLTVSVCQSDVYRYT